MKEKIQNGVLALRKNWQRPRRGECVNFKEVFNFCVGGMGVKMVNSMLNYLTLASTCLLIASVYGLSPRNIMYLFIITNVIGVLKTPIVSMIVDNTRTKIGKFRPYLMWAGIPSIIAVIGLTWFIPVNGSVIVKMVLIGIFINMLSIAQPLYNNAYMGISQTITPNSSERTKILGFSEFLGNLGPSMVQLLLPTIAGIFFGKYGMENIWAYRIFLPIFAISGFLLGLLVMYGSKERVVKAATEKVKVKFFAGIKQLSQNKYFWIVTISKFFDGFKGALTLLLVWVCTYQLQNSSTIGVVQTITSLGFTPGIIIAPLLMKKLGSRKAGFISHLLNCVAAFVMLFTFKQGFAFFVISLFLYNFALGPQYVIQSSIMSDGFDYQQDKLGTRIEGFAQNFQLMITTIGTIVSTVIFTAIYEANGLLEDPVTGLTDYKILTDAAIREPIITTIIIVVIIASVISAIPYLFCDLTQEKLKGIRGRNEKRKFILDNNLETSTEEEIEAAYALYEQKKTQEQDKAAAQLAQEQADFKAKQEEQNRKKEQAILDRQTYIATLQSEGKTEKEIKALTDALDKEARDQKKAAFNLVLAKLKQDRMELKAKKAAFVSAWIIDAKAHGEKRYLKILAKEAFDQSILDEQQLADDSANGDSGIFEEAEVAASEQISAE